MMRKAIAVAILVASLIGGTAQATTTARRDTFRHVKGSAHVTTLTVRAGCLGAEDSAATLRINQTARGWAVHADGTITARYHCDIP